MLRLLLFSALLLLGSCSRNGSETTMDATTLTAKYVELQRQADDMASRLLEMERRLGDTAYFKPSTQGYQVVWVANGFVYVQVRDVKPVEDGYKITFEIGNPLNASLRNVAATITWGATEGRTLAGDNGNARTAQHALKQELKPGTITPVSMVIAPATGDDIASFQIKLTASSAALLRR